jgi:ectoine hydroxylase-related dioxygenase (phytanoyl-CoA dioxygenase family)
MLKPQLIHHKETTRRETVVVNGIEEALRQCGVTETTLAPAEKDALDRHGYIVLPNVMDADWLAQLRAAFERAVSQGQQKANSKQSGTRHVDDLTFKDATFDRVYTHPRILAAVYHVLRRSFVAGIHGRDPLPGYGQQGLHADWLRTPSEPFSVVTTLWLLDDFTPNNGATRLVPGSHLMTTPLPKSMLQPESRHPDEKTVIARAGSVLIFNGHLLHSGTRNKSDRSRRVLQCTFLARDVRLHPAQEEYARSAEARTDIPERLTPAARYILGV